MVEEVVLSHRLHVGADPLSHPAAELLQRHSLPLRCRLHDLGLDRLRKPQPARELHRCPRPVSVEVVVDAALPVDDQGHLHHLQVELLAQVLLDVGLDREHPLHVLHGRKERLVIGGENLLDLLIGADAGASQVCLLVCFCHVVSPALVKPQTAARRARDGTLRWERLGPGRENLLPEEVSGPGGAEHQRIPGSPNPEPDYCSQTGANL
jgi:hypothetical protein